MTAGAELHWIPAQADVWGMKTFAAALCALPMLAQAPWEGRLDLDAFGAYAPDGVQVNLAASGRRVWSGPREDPGAYLDLGGLAALNAAYAYAGLFAEGQPAPFLLLRAEGNAFRYFGTYGSLLSFAHPDDPFGKAVFEARKGEEEKGNGRRLLVQATPQARLGPLVFRHQATVAWWRFGGRGPWFYEFEYDTLLRDGDRTLDQQTSLAWTFRPAQGALYVGPVFQHTRAERSGLTRRRLGLALAYEAAAPRGAWGTWRAALVAGRNQEDRNRRGDLYVTATLGSTWILR